MDYEEKYNAALERAKKLQETCDSTAVVGWCEYIFPELKESDGEKIRKAIISCCIDHGSKYNFGYGYLAHKGNCRFCAERRKQELEVLAEQIKEQ